jgi:hypothetical protein
MQNPAECGVLSLFNHAPVIVRWVPVEIAVFSGSDRPVLVKADISIGI